MFQSNFSGVVAEVSGEGEDEGGEETEEAERMVEAVALKVTLRLGLGTRLLEAVELSFG